MKSNIKLAAIFGLFILTGLLGQSAFGQTGTWTTGASMPGASYGLGAAFVESTPPGHGKFYAISGFATNRIGIYDPTNNSWTTGAPLPADSGGHNLRQYFGCAVVGREIYVIGGDTDGNGVRDTNYAYDTANNTWATKAVLPGGARSGMAAVNLDGKIYVIGGNDNNGQIFARVDIYDPINNTWTTGTSLPDPHTRVVAEGINHKIYLAYVVTPLGAPARGFALVFDPNNPGTWKPIADLPIAGVGHSAVLGGKFFIIGCGTNGAPTATAVQAYDPGSGTWSTNYSPLPIGREDGGVAADETSEKIYDAGGYSGQSLDRLDILSLSAGPPVITRSSNLDYLSTNEVFDPVGNSWAAKARMPTAREGFGIASASGGQDGTWATGAVMPAPSYGLGAKFVNGKLYAISGFQFLASLDSRIRIYDPTNNSWSQGAPLPAALPCRLRQFFGCAVVNGKIYVIGGDDGCGGFMGDPGVYDTNYEYNTANNTWAIKAVLPGGPRWGLAAVNASGKIYAIGGLDVSGNPSSRVDIYDPSLNTWSGGTALPSARTQMAVEVISNKIYLAGGSANGITLNDTLVFDPTNPGLGWVTRRPMPIAGSYLNQSTVLGGQLFLIGCGPSPVADNAVQAYDPILNAWSTNYSLLPTARNIGGAAGDDATGTIYYAGGYKNGFIGELDIISIAPAPTKIYVAGGEVAACPGSQPVATLEGYTPDTDSWVNLGPMPTARAKLGAATVNGVVYFIGGRTGCNGAVGNVEAYNVGPKLWVEKQAMTFPRSEVGVGVINNKIYAVGGDDGSGVSQSKLEVYDPSADSWTTLADMPTARIAPAVGVVNNVLYVIGGYDSAHPNGYTQVEAFDPAGGWTSGLASLPTGRSSGAGGGVLNNKIYVFGGVNSSHEVSTDEVYDPASDTWATAPPIPTARFGLGGTVVNNKLYSVGGVLKGIGTVGQPFIYQVTATNHPASYDAAGLPAGLSIDTALGIISGVPISPSYNTHVQVTATNGAGTGSKTLSFSVQDAPPPGPTLVSNSSATGRTGQSGFSFQVLAKNATLSAKFTAGGLPPGVVLDSDTGVISGVPAADGNFAVSLSVSDANATANTNLQLTFIADSAVPIVMSDDSAVLTPDQSFSYTIIADPVGTYSYIGIDGVRNGALPTGLCFDGIDKISGTYGVPTTCGPVGTVGGNASRGTEASSSLPGDVVTSPPLFASNRHGRKPDTITIRPPLHSSCQQIADNSNGTGTRPLNFFAGYIITVGASQDASGTVSGVYNNDSTVTVTATPNSGFVFVSWTEDGVVVSTSAVYTFPAKRNRTLTANFATATTPTPTPTATPRSAFGDISTRLRVGTGDNAIIGGFIITGIQAKTVVVRGMGPSLPVPGALADPVIEVHGPAGELLASNDNWRDDPNQQHVIDSGLMPPNDFESALWGIINPETYTVVVRGKNAGTGIGLFEVYDLDGTVDSKLANISTRGFVETGDNVMIGGVIILGSTPTSVLLRAIGPSLSNFGVPNPLQDPTLELHDGNGALLAANDNWRSDQEAEIIATGIPPINNLESAVLRSLPPGGYTAIVRGKDNSTGVALVEAYQLQ